MQTIIKFMPRKQTAEAGTSKWGVCLVAENSLVPIMRWSRFHRWAEAGYHPVWPIAEVSLTPISLGMRVGRFQFKEVTSRDNIPFSIQVVVRYHFDPRTAEPQAQKALAQVTAQALLDTVEDRAEQALRRKVSRFRAEEVAGQAAVVQIERDIFHFVSTTLRPMGIHIPKDGVIIKETIAPEKFQQAMIQVRQHRMMMRAFREQHDANVIEQALWADFLNRVETQENNITIFKPADHEVISTVGPFWKHVNGVKKRREH